MKTKKRDMCLTDDQAEVLYRALIKRIYPEPKKAKAKPFKYPGRHAHAMLLTTHLKN